MPIPIQDNCGTHAAAAVPSVPSLQSQKATLDLFSVVDRLSLTELKRRSFYCRLCSCLIMRTIAKAQRFSSSFLLLYLLPAFFLVFFLSPSAEACGCVELQGIESGGGEGLIDLDDVKVSLQEEPFDLSNSVLLAVVGCSGELETPISMRNLLGESSSCSFSIVVMKVVLAHSLFLFRPDPFHCALLFKKSCSYLSCNRPCGTRRIIGDVNELYSVSMRLRAFLHFCKCR